MVNKNNAYFNFQSPELNPPNALTDMDCFYTNCRALAVELQKEHVINLIDQENGEQWPSKIQPRKKEKVSTVTFSSNFTSFKFRKSYFVKCFQIKVKSS